MDDFKEKNGGDDDQPIDLSMPQRGEPKPDQSANGNGDIYESTDDSEDRASGPELPLPVLQELEQEPPVKEPEPPSPDEPPAPPAVDEESGRRLSEQWRIDIKWIFGIPATIILILTLATFTMFRVSSEQVAEDTIDATRQQILSDDRFRDELDQVDPELLKLLESDEFAATMYEDPEMFQSFIEAIPEAEEADPRAGQYNYVKTTLGIYSTLGGTIGKSEHIQARSALIALLLLLALFGIPYVIFSRRLGKIVSVAVSLALASWIPYIFLIYLRGSLSDWIADRADISSDYQVKFLLNMVDSFTDGLVDAATPIYRFFSITAIILLAFGLLGLLVVWWRFDESMVPRKKKLRDTD